MALCLLRAGAACFHPCGERRGTGGDTKQLQSNLPQDVSLCFMFLPLHWDLNLSFTLAEGFTRQGSFCAGGEKGDRWALVFGFQQVVLSGLSLR